jgi:hypothetical protein
MTTPRWEIRDWTNKICFGGKTFSSFEDGWEFIYENDPEPEQGTPEWLDGWYDDYFVQLVPST